MVTAVPAKKGSARHWKFSRCTPVRNLHRVFKLTYVYEYIIKLRRRQAEVIQNHENEYIHGIGQDEARHRKYKRLKLGGSQAYDRSNDYATVVAQDM
jgi:hypothetical protein